jgi:hypothetical protein
VAIFATALFLQTGAFYLINVSSPVDPSWTREIESKCSAHYTSPYRTYEYSIFISQGVCIMPLAAYIGIQLGDAQIVQSSDKYKVLVIASALMIPGYLLNKFTNASWFSFSGV